MTRKLALATSALGILVVALGLVFPAGTFFSRTPVGYYGAQTDAYLSGQLHLKNAPAPALLALPNPYDTRDPLLFVRDLSLFHGHYYLYHGVAPIFTLFAPVRLLTGWWATEAFACVLFALLGAAVSVAMLFRLRAQASIPAPHVLFGTVVLMATLGNGVLVWLAEPGTYQLAQISATFWQVAMLWAGLRAVESQTPLRWAALASLAWGLAVASRPTTILAGAAMAPFAWFLLGHSAPGSRRLLTSVAAWLGPAAVIGCALAWLNLARFGSPFEFGMRFGIAGLGDTREFPFFSPSYFGHSLRVVLTSMPSFSTRFPYLIAGWREPVGILAMPFLFAAFAAPVWRTHGRDERSVVRVTWLATLLVTAANAIPLLLFAYSWSRYTIDFIAPLTLAASIGWLALSEHMSPTARPWLTRLAVAAAIVNVAALWAVFFETLPQS
jgi:hypothetical protein